MGQVMHRLREIETGLRGGQEGKQDLISRFPDLDKLPPELSIQILSTLNATDLCLAGCVWEELANDELLWHGLCLKDWGYASIYRRRNREGFSYKRIYLLLDEATLTFNADPELGLQYLFDHGLVDNQAEELGKFLHYARKVDNDKKRDFLEKEERRDILDHIIKLQDYENQFLPNALRKFFQETKPPNERNSFLHDMVDKFANRFVSCNPRLGLTKDAVYVICFSLILLSVDLSSPHIKNKMSKREFIRNTRRAAQGVNDDFAGHLYDNIYLVGHVAP